jgi:hypothetical protein
VSKPEVHAPNPAVGSPTEEQESTDRGTGEHAQGASAPARATVAESLADIRADRIIGDARREAQAIVDSARVEARREARVIVDSARSEAETIITEAFEQRARIVRRDWAIGDGSWSLAGSEDEGDGDDADGRTVAAEPAAGATPTPAEGMPLPVAGATADVADAAEAAAAADAVGASNGAAASNPVSGVPPQQPPAGGPGAVPDVAPPAVPDIGPRQRPEVGSRPAPEVGSRPAAEIVHRPAHGVAPRQVPDAAAAAKLSELIELPALRARERMAPPPGPETPHESRPPLPARIRRRPAALPRSGPAAPPPPPPPPPAPPAPRAPEQARPRPRPRVERELPAGMRIPPDVPDWDDYDGDADR